MRSVTILLAAGAILAGTAGGDPAGASGPEPAGAERTSSALQGCANALIHSIDRAERQLEQITAAAEVVAKRWLAGAELCVAGNTSFTDEAFYRAGGLIGIRRIYPRRTNGTARSLWWPDVPRDAIILYGLHHGVEPATNIADDLRHLGSRKRTVVLFGSSQWPATRKILRYCRARLPEGRVLFIDTQLPTDTRWAARNGIRFGDAAPAATAIRLWSFTCELIAACTRAGKMPGVWPSSTIPGWRKWEQKYKQIRFHEDITVPPIGPGVLARQYLQTLREQLEALPASAPQVRLAATRLRSISPEKTVYLMVESHLMAGESRLPRQLANWLLIQRGWRWWPAAGTLEPGDAVVWLGYLHWPTKQAESARKKGAAFIGITVRGPRRPASLPENVIWVPATWRYPDAVVAIPDYPLKACPTSGIIQSALLWGLVGELLER